MVAPLDVLKNTGIFLLLGNQVNREKKNEHFKNWSLEQNLI